MLSWAFRMIGMALPPARAGEQPEPVYFLFEDDFCEGSTSDRQWTAETWRSNHDVIEREAIESGLPSLAAALHGAGLTLTGSAASTSSTRAATASRRRARGDAAVVRASPPTTRHRRPPRRAASPCTACSTPTPERPAAGAVKPGNAALIAA